MRAAMGRRSYRRFRGKLLRQLREARGWTQDALASQINVARFTISKWETERDNPDPAKVKQICELFEKPSGFFYDETEQQSIDAAVVIGHLASYTECAPAVLNASRRLLVFQTGGPKAPSWWRNQLRDHLIETNAEIEYRVILCIDPNTITPNILDDMEAARQEFEGASVDLWIFEQKPQLGIDILIVDGLQVFLALHAHTLTTRQCSIHFEDERVADALSRWLLTLSPLVDYETWRSRARLSASFSK
jgi:transcriptional regulator with XRE-family HTH domain